MLVLTRQTEQEIIIGGCIRVKVLEVGGGCVKLGIVAPRHIAVHRSEVYEQLVQNNLAAAESAEAAGNLSRPASPNCTFPA